MKTALFILILVGALSFSTRGFCGSEVGNGGGIAEKNILFAFSSLGHFLNICLQTNACQLDETEKKLIKAIAADLPMEIKTQIVFDSEKKNPGFFKIDDQVRVAKTGDQVGDPIYINSDLLYTELSKNDFKPVDVPLAASILVHELGHHHSVRDHRSLDKMGTKIQMFLLTQTSRSDFWNSNAAVYTLQFNVVRRDEDKRQIKDIDQVILEQKNIYNLTERILSAVQCPDKNDKVVGLRIYNLHGIRGIKFISKTKILKKPFEAWYILSCKAGEESDHGDLSFSLRFTQGQNKQDFSFNPELTEVTQTSCLKEKRVCE